MRKYSCYVLFFIVLSFIVISCKNSNKTSSPSEPESTATPAFTATITLTPTPSWKFVAGVFGGSQGLDLTTSDGTHYLVVTDGDLYDYPIVYKMIGNTFVQQGDVNSLIYTGGVSDISLAVDGINIYLSYYEHSLYGTTVMKFDGNTWTVLGNRAFADTYTGSSSMDVYQGVPYLAYRDEANNYKLKVVKFNGSNWEDIGSASIPDKKVNSISIKVSNDKIYVCYMEDNPMGLSVTGKVIKYGSTIWQELGSGSFCSGPIDHLTLFVDGDTPYVAYKDGLDNCSGYNCNGITVKKLYGSSWATVGTTEFSLGTVDGVSLYVYNGMPYVAFTEAKLERNVTAMKFDGTSWVYIGKQAFMNNYSKYPKIFVYDGIPYVAATYTGAAGLMKFSN